MSNNLMSRPSAVTFIGVCPVALNKAPDTDIIQFFNKPAFPMGDGELVADVKVDTTTTKSGDGTEQTSKVMRSTTESAKWHSNDPNRITPPEVRVGSSVLIFKIGDSDQNYWTVWDTGPEKHRLERVTYAFNASPKSDKNTPFSHEDYYVLDFNPKAGNIRLSTSKANQEKAGYVLQIDGKNGKVSLLDTENNLVMLDSIKKHWLIKNGDDSVISMLQKTITMQAKESITLLGEKAINFKTQALTMITEKTNMKADTLTIIATQTQMQSNTTHIGNLGIVGSMTATGGSSGGGNISTSGDIKADGDVVAGGISLIKHIHNVIDHSVTSKPNG